MPAPATQQATPQRRSWRDWLPWRFWPIPAALAVVFFVAGVPLFLRMPLWCDITLYDMAARAVLAGGVHYRDVFDTNLPGYVWLLAAIRSVVGWSSEALRAVDLSVFAVTVYLLDRLARAGGANRRARWWAVAGACAFYPYTTEFVHAQRDVWLAVPALLAVGLRLRRAVAINDSPHGGGPFLAGCLEGALWAMAFWIKPHILTVAAPVWLLTAWRLAWGHARPWRALAADFAGNFAGGAIIGALGAAQLTASGTWPHFWIIMTEWNPSYSKKAFLELAQRTHQQLYWFPPWSWFLPATVMLAILALLDARPWARRFRDGDASPARWVIRNAVLVLLLVPVAVFRLPFLRTMPFVPMGARRFSRWVADLLHDPTTSDRTRFVRGGLGGLYLAWTAQAFFLQRGFHYVHVTEVMLMLALWSAHRWCLPALVLGWVAITSVIVILAGEPGTPLRDRIDRFEAAAGARDWYPYYFVRHPITDPKRLRHWATCFRTDMTRPERFALADALREMGDFEASPNWTQLNEVAEFLRGRNVGDRELVAWHDSTHPLYLLLKVKPGLRFMHVNTAASIDPEWGPAAVLAELNANERARFAVADIESMGYFAEESYDIAGAYASWWARPTDPTSPPLPPAPMRVQWIGTKPVRDFEFPFDRDPTLPADSPRRYPFDRRPVLFRSKGGTGRYVVFELCQPIRAVFERP